jgi:thiol-disulfide isomerase/thioredoxin
MFLSRSDSSDSTAVASTDPSVDATGTARPDIVFEDFEGTDYKNWTVEGRSFGTKPYAPASNAHAKNSLMTPANGRQAADSFFGSDFLESHELTGKLISPAFTIERNHINFWIAGGEEGAAQAVLRIDGNVQRTSIAQNKARILQPLSWDVSKFLGKTAVIEIVDESKKPGGHLCVDSFVFSDADLSSKNLELVSQAVRDAAQEWNGRRYYFSTMKVPFVEAQQFASQVGGNLLCLESAEETDFIRTSLQDNAWLGIENKNRSGAWIGANQQNYTHGSWRDGAPEYFHQQFAVVSPAGLWQDVGSPADSNLFVIEFGESQSPPAYAVVSPAENRRAAQLLQEKKCACGVVTSSAYHWVTSNTPLLTEDFELRDIRFAKGTSLRSDEVELFKEVKGITRLDLDACDDSVLEILKYTPKLRCVGIYGGQYHWSALKYLQPGHPMRAFGLTGVTVTAEQLRPVFQAAALNHFAMTGMVTSPEVADLLVSQKATLQHLGFNGVPGLGKTGIQKLGELIHLQSALFWGIGVDDETLPAIGRLQNLTTIQLGANKGITGKTLGSLAGLNKLDSISLWSTGLNDAGLQNFPELPSLLSITVGSTDVTDASISHLSRLPRIRSVSVDGTAVTSGGLEKLRAKTSINHIVCSGSKISKQAVDDFGKDRPEFRTDLKSENPAVAAGANPRPSSEPAQTASQLGSAPPEIQAADWLNTNSPVSLESLRGQTVMVEFWATWCGPCVAGIPHLNEMQKKYGDKGFRILSLTAEDRETVEAFQKTREEPIEYTVGLGSETSKAYGVRGIPAAFLIGTDGKLLWNGHPSSPQCEEAIAKALGVPIPASLARNNQPEVKPGKVTDVGKTLESAAKKKAIHETLLKKIEQSKKEVETFKRGHVIVGRVETPGSNDPETVRSQMIIEDEGYFADAVGDLKRPIGFRQPGYRPFDLVIPEGAVPDENGVIDVGTLVMEQAPPSELRRATGQISLEGGGSPEAATVVLYLSSGPVNTPHNGTEGVRRARQGPKVVVDSSGHLIADGLSEGEYWVSYNLPGFVEVSHGYVKVDPQQDLVLKPVELEKPRSISAEFVVAQDSTQGFDASLVRKEKFPAGKRWNVGAGTQQYGWDLEFKQVRRNVTFDYGYSPCTMADLGEGNLADFLKPPADAVQKSPRSVALTSGHVYLLKQGHWKHDVLFRIEVSEPTEPKNPRVLAHLNFNENSVIDLADNGAECDIKNPLFDGTAYRSNGIYENSGKPDGQRFVVGTPNLNFKSFTIAMKFKLQSAEHQKSNILNGGEGYRWFGLSRSDGGNLLIELNNTRLAELTEFPLPLNQWHDLVCAVDLDKGVIGVSVNKKPPRAVSLPAGFQLEVLSASNTEGEKEWTFTNYSYGRTLQGLVDELTIFDGVFTKKEFEDLRGSLEH